MLWSQSRLPTWYLLEFVSTNTSEVVRWNTMSTNDVVYHEMRSLDGLLSGQELNELVEGGTVYYGMKQVCAIM